MNAEFIRRRDQSVHRMLGCIALADVASGLMGAITLYSSPFNIPVIAITAGFSAMGFYVAACENYACAKGHRGGSGPGLLALGFSVTAFFILLNVTGMLQHSPNPLPPIFSAAMCRILMLVSLLTGAFPLKQTPDRA